MKRTLLLTSLLCSAILLAACAPGASGSFLGLDLGGSASGGGFSGSRSLTDEEKLAIGTIKLDSTGQKISSAEAQHLLPLWQLLHQLHSSSAAAPQEIAAVVSQIRSTMGPAQVSAIDSMQYTRADLFAAFQQGQGGTSQANSRTGASRSQSFAGGNSSRGGGGQTFFFAGPGAAGTGGFDGGGFRNNAGAASSSNATGTQQSTDPAQRAQAFNNGVVNALINQVIALLQNKLSS